MMYTDTCDLASSRSRAPKWRGMYIGSYDLGQQACEPPVARIRDLRPAGLGLHVSFSGVARRVRQFSSRMGPGAPGRRGLEGAASPMGAERRCVWQLVLIDGRVG